VKVGVSFDAGKLTADDWLVDTAQPPKRQARSFSCSPGFAAAQHRERNYHRKGFKTGQLASFHLEDE
jgi:hypothetical protein